MEGSCPVDSSLLCDPASRWAVLVQRAVLNLDLVFDWGIFRLWHIIHFIWLTSLLAIILNSLGLADKRAHLILSDPGSFWSTLLVQLHLKLVKISVIGGNICASYALRIHFEVIDVFVRGPLLLLIYLLGWVRHVKSFKLTGVLRDAVDPFPLLDVDPLMLLHLLLLFDGGHTDRSHGSKINLNLLCDGNPSFLSHRCDTDVIDFAFFDILAVWHEIIFYSIWESMAGVIHIHLITELF